MADEKRKSWGIQTRGKKEKKTREKLGCAKFFLQIESIFSNPTPFFFSYRARTNHGSAGLQGSLVATEHCQRNGTPAKDVPDRLRP